jgi:hypothetical protein
MLRLGEVEEGERIIDAINIRLDKVEERGIIIDAKGTIGIMRMRGN